MQHAGLKDRDRWLFTLSLAQAGEFGFVLVAFSVQQNVIPTSVSEELLLIIALSMLITPIILYLGRPLISQENGYSKCGQFGDLKVFLSYSREDLHQMTAIAKFLEIHGFTPVYDTRNLPFGEDWQSELKNMIAESDIVVWLISRSAIKSYWCNWEVEQVLKFRKRMVPIMINNVSLKELPHGIRERHIFPGSGCIDLSNRDHIDSFISVLGTDYTWLKLYTRLSDRALSWANEDRDVDRLLKSSELKEAEEWKNEKPPLAPDPMPVVLDFIHSSKIFLDRN